MIHLNTELERLQGRVIRCQKCPRLDVYFREIERKKPKRFQDWTYWSKPLPSFGDPDARVLIIGLAPAANGGNRTGRMFTGDRSGEWLFGALHRFGFANQPNSDRRDDDFALKDCYITATIRCAPPGNKPLPEETVSCRPFFLKELDLLKNVKIFVPLGQIAFVQTLKALRFKGYDIPPLPFGHGKIYSLSKQKELPTPVGNGLKPFPTKLRTITLITTYHPSQQNTQTGKLTRPMFHQIFKMIRTKLKVRST
ncbi:MAG: uracil-DNA glycosylase [Thermodesulfobacteriota bacterium]|nr:uracil-DNA glycosylase [Thermodesulfobacteriota bacterium]